MKNEKEIINLTDKELEKVTGGKEYSSPSDGTDNSGTDSSTVIYAEIEDKTK